MHIHKFNMHGIPLPPKPIKQELQRTQPPGEGRWVNPVDSPNVQAMWLPKSTATTTTWEPIPNLQWQFPNDEEQLPKIVT